MAPQVRKGERERDGFSAEQQCATTLEVSEFGSDDISTFDTVSHGKLSLGVQGAISEGLKTDGGVVRGGLADRQGSGCHTCKAK